MCDVFVHLLQVNDNFNFVQFGQWENQRAAAVTGLRDGRKCLQPDPDHCGR